MATSGSYDYTTTRSFIVTEAFRKIGALGDTETLDTTRMGIGVNTLNTMVKAFVGQGLHVWARTTIVIPFSNWTTAIPNIQIGPGGVGFTTYKPLKLLEAYRRDTLSNVDTPLIVITPSEFDQLPNKFSLGTPTQVWYQPQNYNGNLHLWLCPDSYWSTNGSFCGVFQRPIQDLDQDTDEPDFPKEWHEALIYQLAVRLAPHYGMAINDRALLKQEAKEALDLALGFDQEVGSLYITPRRM